MKRLVVFLAFLFGLPVLAQTGAINGLCSQGGVPALVSGLKSTNYLDGIVPSCSVTVYLTGTTTKATIFSNAGGTILGNPFTATVLGSAAPGSWLFYASTSNQYDVVLSGGIAPNTYVVPVTLTGLSAGGGGGGSPGGTAGAIQWNNSGSFGGAVITGLVAGNGTSAPALATQSQFNPFLINPGPIGGGTANAGTFTTLDGSSITASTSLFLSYLTGNTNPLCLNGSGSAITNIGCVSGAVSSVSNSDGTLTITPTTGAVVASLALGHANTWTAPQTFAGSGPPISIPASKTATPSAGNTVFGTDSANNLDLSVNNVTGTPLVPLASGFTSGHCPEPTLSGGVWTMVDAGAACGSGSSSAPAGFPQKLLGFSGPVTAYTNDGNSWDSYGIGGPSNVIFLAGEYWQAVSGYPSAGFTAQSIGLLHGPSLTQLGMYSGNPIYTDAIPGSVCAEGPDMNVDTAGVVHITYLSFSSSCDGEGPGAIYEIHTSTFPTGWSSPALILPKPSNLNWLYRPFIVEIGGICYDYSNGGNTSNAPVIVSFVTSGNCATTESNPSAWATSATTVFGITQSWEGSSEIQDPQVFQDPSGLWIMSYGGSGTYRFGYATTTNPAANTWVKQSTNPVEAGGSSCTNSGPTCGPWLPRIAVDSQGNYFMFSNYNNTTTMKLYAATGPTPVNNLTYESNNSTLTATNPAWQRGVDANGLYDFSWTYPTGSISNPFWTTPTEMVSISPLHGLTIGANITPVADTGNVPGLTLGAVHYPLYWLKATGAPTNETLWRSFTRDDGGGGGHCAASHSCFVIGTTSDDLSVATQAVEITRNLNTITGIYLNAPLTVPSCAGCGYPEVTSIVSGTSGANFAGLQAQGVSGSQLPAYFGSLNGNQTLTALNTYYSGAWNYTNTGPADAMIMTNDAGGGALLVELCPNGTAGGTLPIGTTCNSEYAQYSSSGQQTWFNPNSTSPSFGSTIALAVNPSANFTVDFNGNVISAAATATNVTDSALTSGNCVQASTGGLLATTGVPCPLASAHSDYASIQGALFTTNTMLGPVFAEPLQVHFKTLIVRLSGTISCSAAPVVSMMDLGTSPTTSFGSAVGSVAGVTTGTSDGVYQFSASVNMTPGDYYGFAFTSGTCVTAPTFDITAQVQ